MRTLPGKLVVVAGARPNFMKVAPLLRELAAREQGGMAVPPRVVVHTGQHYDHGMSGVFFEELGIPEPDHHLNVGAGSHAVQTARVMEGFEPVCLAERPGRVIVVGDVNSTLACALTAAKLNVPVAHIEAGLRSGDRAMPEELNRIVTDALADLLFVTERSGVENLRREGKPEASIHLVGNLMIDTLLHQLARLDEKRSGGGGGAPPAGEGAAAPPSGQDEGIEMPAGDYAVVTLHRPSNVDDPAVLTGIVEALAEISRDLPIVFPVHPRTRKNIDAHGLGPVVAESGITFVAPLPYRAFLRLWSRARLVLTDSGGLQEETTALGIPCFTIRENTERPVTVTEGTNTLVGTTREGILAAWGRFRAGETKSGRRPELWDGRAAARIADILLAEGGR
jgi:UDP-N-acetylglucosamine 2-epimerase (non-hydrolysing)